MDILHQKCRRKHCFLFLQITPHNVVTITLSLERFQNFSTKCQKKFDFFRNWAVIGELMSLPVAITSSI